MNLTAQCNRKTGNPKNDLVVIMPCRRHISFGLVCRTPATGKKFYEKFAIVAGLSNTQPMYKRYKDTLQYVSHSESGTTISPCTSA